MGFLPDIQRIINLLPKQRQNLMFSATFSGDIRKLAESFLKDPVSVEVARRNATAENVEQKVYRVANTDAKRAAVAKLVKDNALSQVIVFTNTKIGAGRLARQLEKEGLNASAIHGDKSQQERLATLEGFKKGEIAILVATDVAARGLDIAELPAVINYDLPYSPEDYVHRIGRTGRAGASGIALALMTAEDERLLHEIEKLIKRQLPVETLAVEAPPRDPAARDWPREGGRDRPRPARDEARGARDSRPPRESRHADRGERSDRRPSRTSMPGFSNDPFFFKPYEPSAPADSAESGAGTASAPTHGVRKRPARPLAALLGGGKKA